MIPVDDQSLPTSFVAKTVTVTLPPSLLLMVHFTYSSLTSVTYAAAFASNGALWAAILSFSGSRRKNGRLAVNGHLCVRTHDGGLFDKNKQYYLINVILQVHIASRRFGDI